MDVAYGDIWRCSSSCGTQWDMSNMRQRRLEAVVLLLSQDSTSLRENLGLELGAAYPEGVPFPGFVYPLYPA